MSFYNHYFVEDEDLDGEYFGDIYEIDLKDLKGVQLDEVHKRFLMSNTDPARIKRARNDIKTHRRNIRVQFDKNGDEIIEYDFRANPSREFRNHWGYAIHDGDDVKQVFCDCKDFFYRLYAPLVKAGLATWDIPPKYKKRMEKFIKPHNHEWTVETNPEGKLYVCKHLYALLLEFVDKDIKARPLAGVKISPKVKRKIAADKKRQRELDRKVSDVSDKGDKKVGDKHIGTDDVNNQDAVDAEIEARKASEEEAAEEEEAEDEEVEDELEQDEDEKKKKK
tara:strand:- start:5833 stop:6669 length:837 start_codon:yes stop_codon:yes gene_type:complete